MLHFTFACLKSQGVVQANRLKGFGYQEDNNNNNHYAEEFEKKKIKVWTLFSLCQSYIAVVGLNNKRGWVLKHCTCFIWLNNLLTHCILYYYLALEGFSCSKDESVPSTIFYKYAIVLQMRIILGFAKSPLPNLGNNEPRCKILKRCWNSVSESKKE